MSSDVAMMDLMGWMKDVGLVPQTFHPRDRFVNPFTRRVHSHKNMAPHQLRHALWIPSFASLKKLLPSLQLHRQGHIYVAVVDQNLGAGPGEAEAILSLAHDIRSDVIRAN